MSAKPLDGLRVIEMGQLIAGPYCAQLLGDFGAEVIKIEPPKRGDPMRNWGHHQYRGKSVWWPIIARNKRSVTCDLRTEKGQQLARDLIGSADIAVENFRPGTLERWGLDFETLRARNPGLILTRVTGFGQDGPYASRAGFGSIGEAMGGIRFLTGYPEFPPTRVGISLGDSLAGLFAALGTLCAVQHRHNTGVGQIVDAAIYESVLALMESSVAEWELTGHQRERSGAVLANVSPSNVYPTSDGAELLISANQDSVFRRLADVIGRPDLITDERFSTHLARGVNMVQLDDVIAQWSKTMTFEEAMKRLQDNGVPADKIYTANDMIKDQHFQARKSIVRVQDPVLGDVPMHNVFPRLSETPGGVESTGPELGQDNAYIYGSILNLTSAQLQSLAADGII